MIRIPEVKEAERYRILRETASDYAARELVSGAEQFDLDPGSPEAREAVLKAGELGMLSAPVPEKLGGGGLDPYAFCVALEEIAVESAGVAVALLAHNAALLPAVLSEDEALISRMISGSSPSCLAYPGELSITGGKINGGVPFAFNAPGCSYSALFPSGGEGIVAAVVEGETEGVEIGDDVQQMGLRAARAASVQFSGAEPAAILPDGERMLNASLRTLCLGLAAAAAGIARKALEKAYAYASERYQAGSLIIEHQQMRIMLAGMLAGIEESRAMIKRACESEELAPAIAAWIKAAQNACEAAVDGVQIHGGYGYMRDYGMERLMRDAKYCQIYPMSGQEALLKLLELSETD